MIDSQGERRMNRECEICGIQLNSLECEGVCLACQHGKKYICSRCGAVMQWRDRDHLLCKSCRHSDHGETITDGKY